MKIERKYIQPVEPPPIEFTVTLTLEELGMLGRIAENVMDPDITSVDRPVDRPDFNFSIDLAIVCRKHIEGVRYL